MTDERNIQDILAEVADQAELTRDKITRLYRSRRPAVEPSQVYSIRIPVSRLGRIRALATKYGMAPTAMLRTWILERLDAEERSSGTPSPESRMVAKNSEFTATPEARVIVFPHVQIADARKTSAGVYERKLRECTSDRHPRMAEC
jgi:hypothetical protein